MSISIDDALLMISKELLSAEKKFPCFPADAIHAASIVAEESGELVRASLQYTYEKGSPVPLLREAVQTGAMALRFILNFEHLAARKSSQWKRGSNDFQKTGKP